MPSEMTELELVRRAKQERGGPAFAELVRRYERPLFNFLLRSLRNRARSEELFQECFMRCFRGLSDFDADSAQANFRAWLYRIAVHLIRDEMRRPAHRRAHEVEQQLGVAAEAEPPPTPENTLAREQQRERVRQAITSLPELSREVVLLHQYQGLSYQEIAEALHVPLGTVKSRMHAALTQLRKVLVTDGDDAAAKEVAS